MLTDYTGPIPVRDSSAVPLRWEPNCEEYITLRKNTQGDYLDQIPLKEVFTLLGWDGVYARVDYRGQQGYVLSSYIKPEKEDYFADCLRKYIPMSGCGLI